MRRVLLVLFGLGMFAGFGSAFAHARSAAHHRWGHECGGEWSRSDSRDDWRRDDARQPAAVAAPAAPAPQIFVITVPSGVAQPAQVVLTPASPHPSAP